MDRDEPDKNEVFQMLFARLVREAGFTEAALRMKRTPPKVWGGMKYAHAMSVVCQQSKMGRWSSLFEKHKAVRPHRDKMLLGLASYGWQVNMWPCFDKCPMKGIEQYDFRFADLAVSDESVADDYEAAPVVLQAVRGSRDPPPVAPPLARDVRASNASMAEAMESKKKKTRWMSRRGF